MQKIAVLTSGGDAPGMNACVVSIARSAAARGMPLIGIKRGYNGLSHQDNDLLDAFFAQARKAIGENAEQGALLSTLEAAVYGRFEKQFPEDFPMEALSDFLGNERVRSALCVEADYQKFVSRFPSFAEKVVELDIDTVLDIADLPGTYLRTARCKAFFDPHVRLRAVVYLLSMGVEGLVVIGGDGSFHGARSLCEIGMPCIGIPATIDNDLVYSEMSLGYDTAVNVCLEGVRRIRATSRSHDRPHVVEVMGNRCGNIALRTAVASGAEYVLVPEKLWSVEDVARKLQREIDGGNLRATIVIAEGAYDTMRKFDLYGYLSDAYQREDAKLGEPKHRKHACTSGEIMSARRLAEVMGYMCEMPAPSAEKLEVRSTIMGYTQRGESPGAYDSAFAFEVGYRAVQLLLEGKKNLAVGVLKGELFEENIDKVIALQKKGTDMFNHELYDIVNTL